jgi:hypothetical protein
MRNYEMSAVVLLYALIIFLYFVGHIVLPIFYFLALPLVLGLFNSSRWAPLLVAAAYTIIGTYERLKLTPSSAEPTTGLTEMFVIVLFASLVFPACLKAHSMGMVLRRVGGKAFTGRFCKIMTPLR